MCDLLGLPLLVDHPNNAQSFLNVVSEFFFMFLHFFLGGVFAFWTKAHFVLVAIEAGSVYKPFRKLGIVVHTNPTSFVVECRAKVFAPSGFCFHG